VTDPTLCCECADPATHTGTRVDRYGGLLDNGAVGLCAWCACADTTGRGVWRRIEDLTPTHDTVLARAEAQARADTP
jgi:hypothetical protein